MLQKQTLTIPLGLGVNTKTDEKIVEQGQFNLVCENATFKKIGAVQKRQAYKSEPTTYRGASGQGDYTLISDKPVSAMAMGSVVFLKNRAGEYFYKYSDEFIYGPQGIPECKARTVSILPARTTVDLADCDYDSNEGILVVSGRNGYTQADNSDHSSLVIYDYATGSTVTRNATNGSGAERFGFSRCAWTRNAGDSTYYHIYVNSNQDLGVRGYNKFGELTYTLTQSGVLSDGASMAKKGPIAICRSADDQSIFIFVPSTTANVGRVLIITGTTTTLNSTFAYTGTGWNSSTAKLESGFIYLAYSNSTLQVRQVVFNTSGVVTSADSDLVNATSANSIAWRRDGLSGLIVNSSDGMYEWDSSTKTIQNYNTNAYTDMVDLDGQFCIFTIDLLEQLTYFGMSLETSCGATTFFRGGSGTGTLPTGQLGRIAKVSDNIAVIAHPVAATVNAAGSISNLALTFLEFSADYKSGSRVTLGPNLHFQGGFLTEFDGETVFENGFHLKCPDLILDTATAGTLSGTFSYRGVLKFTDRNGQITRSEPSDIVTTSALVSKQVEIRMLSMPFGIKPFKCQIEIYRTVSGGTSFFFVTDKDINMYGSQYAWTGDIVDQAADASINTNTILYTTGNVLPNHSAPGCGMVTQGGNRMFLAGLQDENEVAYSKKKLFGECVNFSDLLRIRFDSAQFNISGGVTAHGYMDGKYIAFKKNSIFYVSGDGPLETGADNTFTDPELISAEAGCSEPRSVVLGPQGLFFKSDKGIYLLGRGLDTKYIGAGVEAYNDYKVTSSVHLDQKNQIIFTVVDEADTSIKYMLAYDYFSEQWSVTVGLRAIDGDVLDGEHLILNSATSTPMVQNGADYLDDAAVYAMKTKTPWIKVSGIQDFGRIWSCTILGKYKAAHTLTVKVRYDYNESYVETYAVAPLLADTQYQYRVHLLKQKCQAVQFEIYDSNQTGTGESMELTALTLEVGLRKGGMKLPAARKY